VLGVTIPPLLESSPSRIAEKAAGNWREVDRTPAETMEVVGAGSTYLVTYPRWHYEREPFVLVGDELLGGGGENTMNDRVKTITYDNGPDRLTISDKSGDHVYTLARASGGVP
jgi:hypothetical protein